MHQLAFDVEDALTIIFPQCLKKASACDLMWLSVMLHADRGPYHVKRRNLEVLVRGAPEAATPWPSSAPEPLPPTTRGPDWLFSYLSSLEALYLMAYQSEWHRHLKKNRSHCINIIFDGQRITDSHYRREWSPAGERSQLPIKIKSRCAQQSPANHIVANRGSSARRSRAIFITQRAAL